MNRVEFINRQRKIKITKELKDTLSMCVDAALEGECIQVSACVDITFVSDNKIKQINREYRGKNAPTDVLSFPMLEFSEGRPLHDVQEYMDEDGTMFLGDIIISLERAAAQAEEYGHSFLRETGFLCVHSALHLLGYDHEDSEESRKAMRVKEEAALDSIGLAR